MQRKQQASRQTFQRPISALAPPALRQCTSWRHLNMEHHDLTHHCFVRRVWDCLHSRTVTSLTTQTKKKICSGWIQIHLGDWSAWVWFVSACESLCTPFFFAGGKSSCLPWGGKLPDVTTEKKGEGKFCWFHRKTKEAFFCAPLQWVWLKVLFFYSPQREGQGTGLYTSFLMCQEDAQLIPDDDEDEQIAWQQHLRAPEEEGGQREEEPEEEGGQREEDPMHEGEQEEPYQIPVKEEAMEEIPVKEEEVETEQDPNLEWNDADHLYDDGTTLGRAELKAKEDCFSWHGQNILNHSLTQKDLGPFQSHPFKKLHITGAQSTSSPVLLYVYIYMYASCCPAQTRPNWAPTTDSLLRVIWNIHRSSWISTQPTAQKKTLTRPTPNKIFLKACKPAQNPSCSISFPCRIWSMQWLVWKLANSALHRCLREPRRCWRRIWCSTWPWRTQIL